MKTKIILAIAFVFCLSLPGLARGAGTTISINPSSSSISQSQIGTDFQINISISDVTNLWSWKVRLNWNPDVLNVTNVEEGPFLKSVGPTLFPPPPQRNGYLTEVSCTLLSPSSASGDGVLATVTFKVLASGQSSIILNETELLEPGSGHPQINCTINNGQITIVPEFTSWSFLGIAFAATVLTAILIKKRFRPTRDCDRRNNICAPGETATNVPRSWQATTKWERVSSSHFHFVSISSF